MQIQYINFFFPFPQKNIINMPTIKSTLSLLKYILLSFNEISYIVLKQQKKTKTHIYIVIIPLYYTSKYNKNASFFISSKKKNPDKSP